MDQHQNVKLLKNFDLPTFREASMESAMFSMIDLPTCEGKIDFDDGGKEDDVEFEEVYNHH